MDATELDDRLERQDTERKSHERDRRLLDTMPQCIWAADAEGRVNYWNRAGLEYCGLDAAALTDGSFWEVLHADDRDEARVHWERGLRGEPTFERQVRLRRASDGRFRWHLVRAVAERASRSSRVSVESIVPSTGRTDLPGRVVTPPRAAPWAAARRGVTDQLPRVGPPPRGEAT